MPFAAEAQNFYHWAARDIPLLILDFFISDICIQYYTYVTFEHHIHWFPTNLYKLDFHF